MCRASLPPCHEAAGMSWRDGWTDGSALGGFWGRAGLAVGACVSCACRSGSRAKSVRDLVEISKFLFGEAKSLEISFTLGGPQISKRISRDPGISQRGVQRDWPWVTRHATVSLLLTVGKGTSSSLLGGFDAAQPPPRRERGEDAKRTYGTPSCSAEWIPGPADGLLHLCRPRSDSRGRPDRA